MGFRQLEVVIWKNLIIRKRHWFLTTIEAFLPVCLFLLIAYGRSQISGLSKIEVPEPTYNPIEGIRYDINVGNAYILYTPSSDYYTNIISKMHTKLAVPSDQVQRFGTEKELLEYYYKNPNYTTIAIIFDDADRKKFNYKIRYHEYQSYNNEFLYTNERFDKVYAFSPGRGGPYKFKDFIPIQMALDMSFLEYNLNLTTDIEDKYSVVTQEFPYAPHKIDSAITTLFLEFLPLITLFSFIFLCPAVLKRVVEEKYSGTKELMKMVGMKSWMLWLGWFIYALIPMIWAILFIVIFMKVRMFHSDYPLIEHSNGGILFCFLFLYCAAAVAFCFAISSFFSRPTIALVTGILIWILSFFVPKYALGLDESNQLSWSSNVFLNLLPNMALHYGYSIIAVYEEREVGVQWYNYYKSSSGSSDDLTMLNLYLMLIFDTVFYVLFTFYMDGVNPGKFGVKKSVIFPIRNLIKMFRKSSTDKVKVNCETVRLEKVEEGLGLYKGIEINQLHKRYGHKVAVNNLNLDIYKNQITVLLGHNGAGKSTTMSVLTGMLQATSGSVKINGLDINVDMDEIRQSLGLCPQHNLLFPDLTVKEHLLFFAKLKGKSSKEAAEEAEQLLKTLNMSDKENSMANALSGGMQRKLCLGMAVIGGSKVLILDEPSSGMDPQSRRHLWDLLLAWRGEKTILITTHFMEEADALGDWIAIMSNGTLNCYGTPMFLKKKYNTGYHLSLMTKAEANKENIKSEIFKYIPEAQLKSVDGNNMVFVLPFEKNSEMTDMLTDLEAKRPELKIENISVTITTLEDVFLKTHLESTGHSDDTSSFDSQDVKIESHLKLTLMTLFVKKFQFSWQKPYTYLIPIIVAFVFFMLTGYLSRSNDYYSENGPELHLKLSTYRQTSVFYNGTSESSEIQKMMIFYRDIVEAEKSLPFQVKDVEQSILTKGVENIAYYREHMIAGANFIGDKSYQLVALYNAVALHSLPISLNLITDTLAKTLLGPEYSISISNWPLPQVSERISSQEFSEAKVAVLWLILLPVGCLFIHGSFIIFPHTEISTKFMRMQYMCGVKPFWYWIVNFIADIVFYAVIMVLLGLLLLGISPMLHWYEFGHLLSIFLLYGLAGIPFAYLFSRKTSASGAFALFIIMGMFLGIILTITIGILAQSQDQYYINIGNNIKYFCFLFVPQVGLSDALVTFSRRAVTIYNYEVSPKKLSVTCYTDSHACCVENSLECQKFKNFTGLFNEHLLMLGGCVIYLVLNMILDTYWLLRLTSAIRYRYNKHIRYKLLNPGERESQSKYDEYDNNEGEGNNTSTLKAEKLLKFYDGQKIVKNINLTLKHGQCLGILGVNGAGKTTTFRMLTREETVDEGTIQMKLGTKKINIGTNEYLETLGYCPQSDSLNFVLTGRQILTSIAALRGVYDKDVVDNFLNLFDLKKDADVPCGYYSGGNKRKLSLALSLIGFREFVLLDEPTNGVDPSTRRKCWSLIKKMQADKGFILTSHSMTECEALCDELKIMKSGQFVEEGSLSELKNKFGGFTLKLKLSNKAESKIDDLDEVDGLGSATEEVKFKTIGDIKEHFTKNDRGEIKDEHTGLLHFYIKDKNKKWSDIFKEVEEIKANNSHLIEDYAISEASLEDVFLKVARSDDEADGTEEVKKKKERKGDK